MAKDSIEFALEDFEQGAEARVEIRFSGPRSIRAALGLLSRCCLEVIVAAREANGTHVPAQVASREQEGSRWNGA